MTEPMVSGGITAPVVPVPVAAEPAPVPATTAPAAAVPQGDPAWLAPRLEQSRRAAETALLSELGVADKAAAKAILDAAKARADAEKTAETRLAELAPKTTRLETVTREFAGRMMGALTPEQQATVRSFHPDTDPASQLDVITKLGPTWAAQASVAVAAAPAPVAPAIPAATTGPGPTAPAGGPSTSEPDHKSVYQTTRAKNPFAAAAYGLENASSVYKNKN